MTLSNFDWTDKDSVKWFIILPTGHEGPYSLNGLLQLVDKKKLAADVKIWAEGLSNPVMLREASEYSSAPVVKEEEPELPPLPEEEIPPIPVPEEEKEDEVIVPEAPAPKKKVPVWVFGIVVIGFMIFFVINSTVKNKETFTIRRFPKMSLEIHQRIMNENAFGGWDKKIFFKEYLPHDHSHIWLVTSSFQECDVEAIFNSLPNKLLTMDDEKITFRSKTHLSGHVAEFSSFEFTSGNKIVPGMYEMDVKAHNCTWDGFVPKLMNGFVSPDNDYMARIKVVLFSRGAEEYNRTLEKLLIKKMEIELKEQNQNVIFWQDLEQKLETLQAITLQIEQHILDFLSNDPSTFKKNLKPMVDSYTRKFGSFLTSFVVENENYFNSLSTDVKGASQKRNYELMVRLTSKKIGLESMKYIEEFQGIKKNPGQKDLDQYSDRVKKTFSTIKADISSKLLQVEEDQEK